MTRSADQTQPTLMKKGLVKEGMFGEWEGRGEAPGELGGNGRFSPWEGDGRREVAAISPSPPPGPLVRVHCLEDPLSSSQSIQNTFDTFLSSPKFFLFVCDTPTIHAAVHLF